MRIPGLKTLEMSARWIRSRFTNHALILGYHRVADEQRDPYALCVRPQHFDDHMAVLRALATPIHLVEFVKTLEDGHLPPRAVVVTFDDGYADNLYNAKPLLDKHQVPATVFMIAGHIGGEFWWDDLVTILMSPQGLPERLDISTEDFKYQWTFQNSIPRNSLDGETSFRKRLLWDLYKRLLPLSAQGRSRVISHLRNWAGIKADASSTCRAMTSDELLELVANDLIDVGTHTVTHPYLSELVAADQRSEILLSKEILERILNRKVKSFSYPHGRHSNETAPILRESGFICACASFNDTVRHGSDPFCLPRFWIQDWDRKRFKRWLQRWLSHFLQG